MNVTVRNAVKESKGKMYNELLDEHVEEVRAQGYEVEFGKIGLRTTYAMIYTEDHDIEFVGYTFIKNMTYYNEVTGKLKALQQAIARKDIAAEER